MEKKRTDMAKTASNKTRMEYGRTVKDRKRLKREKTLGQTDDPVT